MSRSNAPKYQAGRCRTEGFSLVELMLALALGLVIIAGIVQLFVGNSRTAALGEGQARMQENARFAFNFISRAARRAGYLGCAPESANIVKGLVGNWNEMPEYNITRAVEGYEGNADGTWTPALTSLPGGTPGNVNDNPAGAIATGLISPGTDILVFRNLQQPGQKLAQTLQPDGDPVVTAPGGNPGFGVDDIVMVSDCEQAVVIRVTGMNVVGNEATLLHTTGAGRFDNAVAITSPTGVVPFTMSILGRSYGAEASVGTVESTFFFIAPSTRPNRQGDPVLALWQKVGRTGPVELIQGVDDLQVRYGIDTTLADGIANSNQYVSFDAVPANVGQIVAIRIAIAVNSVDAVTDDGNPLERTFSKTIMVRNANPEA